MTFGWREEFEYFICDTCASVSIGTLPENIARYYEGYSNFTWRPPETRGLKLLIVLMRLGVGRPLVRACKALIRNPREIMWAHLSPNMQAMMYLAPRRTARILDVGSGGGEMIELMRRMGYSAALGLDPFIPDDHQLVRAGMVRRMHLADVHERYDVVVFNHSLEHVPDPEAVLGQARDALVEGGTVLVQIPNVDSIDFRKYRGNWWVMHAPRHFHMPSERGLAMIADRVGLEIVDRIFVSRPDHYFYSREYQQDIWDNDPRSWRMGKDQNIWTMDDFREAARMTLERNRSGGADWVSFYLRAKR